MNECLINNKMWPSLAVIIWKMDLQLPVQSLPITPKVMSRTCSGNVYSKLCNKFVSDLRQVGGFFRVLWFPPPIKLTDTM